nr:hypothetical protein Itr_chr06CG11930 [Ipomoea trifida]
MMTVGWQVLILMQWCLNSCKTQQHHHKLLLLRRFQLQVSHLHLEKMKIAKNQSAARRERKKARQLLVERIGPVANQNQGSKIQVMIQ